MNDNQHNKRCGRCSHVLPLAAFAKDASRKDGRANKCRTCKRTMNRENYERQKENKMNQEQEKVICYLDLIGKHRLAYDSNQWFVQRRHKASWSTLAYVGSTSDTLLRVIRENGIELTDMARKVITMFPRFLDWKRTWPDSGFKAA